MLAVKLLTLTNAKQKNRLLKSTSFEEAIFLPNPVIIFRILSIRDLFVQMIVWQARER
ncbi:hypothetical protein SAMN05444955_102329 [Lihuaxuella thermophila]|uniref:Uncharacterized protein n=1 Tax=Lihuaxuella thermophila TaxID=1173111 RepID=A0A1H8BRV8_9BACL|nr:hypothetical protein SAMN05444955_102329 [Lihuaxuella thermophila]